MTAEYKKAIQIIDRAIELIATPEKWTKGGMAKNSAGKAVDARDPEAVCFCLHGALSRAVKEKFDIDIDLSIVSNRLFLAKVYKIVFDLIYRQLKVKITVFNDSPNITHADVIALLRAARVSDLAKT